MKKVLMLCVLCTVAALAFYAVNAEAAAGLSIDKVIINFRPASKPIDNINVTNRGDKAFKVTVSTIEVTHSDLPDQKEEPSEKLVVAPSSPWCKSGFASKIF